MPITEYSLHEESGRRASEELFHTGALFHRFRRYRDLPALSKGGDGEQLVSIDRLTGILSKGLLAPDHSQDGLVVSDLNIKVIGSIAYSGLIFLHKYDPECSSPYTMLGGIARNDSCIVTVDQDLPILEPADMGKGWPMFSRDEVYSPDPIPADRLQAVYMPLRFLSETAVQAALEGHDMPVFTY